MKRVSEVQREYIIRFAMIEDLDINVTAEIVGMNPRTLKDWVRKEKKGKFKIHLLNTLALYH